MPKRVGRNMGYTSKEVTKIYRNLKNGNESNSNIICDAPGCRGGFRVNTLTNEFEECPKCKGYGFIRNV